MSKRVLENHEIVLVNISDPHADAAEIAIMRRDGDKSLLILPMLYQGAAIGLIEVLDHVRERRYGRQEMRLATAIAGQAAVAMHNAKVFAQLRRSDRDVHSLCKAIERVTAALGTLTEQTTTSGLLQSVATVACVSLEAISSVASFRGESAGASGAAPAAAGEAAQSRSNSAHVIVSSAPCEGDQLTITVTLPNEAGDGQAELLTLVTTAATVALRSLATR